ncbi:MAG: hypothetical protein E7350_04655 [Clostridiales bacterium]|nr:hypothetical protein [Clostridiales bacterium]
MNSINSDLIRGHIDTIILKALQAGDRYGYDIIKEIEQKSEGQYIIKQPTLYSCLKRLEVQGFVKSYWGSKSIGGRKKYFTLTDMGRELFVKNKNDWDYSRDIINKLISDDDYTAVDFEEENLPTEHVEINEEEITVGQTTDEQTDAQIADEVDEVAIEEIGVIDDAISSSGFETPESEELLLECIDNTQSDQQIIEEASEDVVDATTDAVDEQLQLNEVEGQNIDDVSCESSGLNELVEETPMCDTDSTSEADNEAQSAEVLAENPQEPCVEENVAVEADDAVCDNEINVCDDVAEPALEAITEATDNIVSDEEATLLSDSEEGAGEQTQTEENPIDEVPLPLSAAEQNHNVDENVNQDEDCSDIVSSYYNEQGQDSYIGNANNAKYEEIQSSSVFDSSNYFADIVEEDYEEEEIASALATETVDVPDPQIEQTETHINPPQYGSSQRILRETPQEQDNSTVFYSYKRPAFSAGIDETSSIIDKEYRGVISALISDNIVATKPITDYVIREYKPTPKPTHFATEQAEKNNDKQTVSNEIAAETGDNINMRAHNHVAIKLFNNKHFYYANQLRLMQSGIMFGIMLLEIILCFYFIEVLHNKFAITSFNLGMYISAVIFAAAFPIVSFALARTNYYYRKRINYNARSNMLFSIAATVLLMLIIFFINVYAGILIGDINNYLSSLILPMLLSTNVIVHVVLFHYLYKSGKYNIER